jgi:hypothetical protein
LEYTVIDLDIDLKYLSVSTLQLLVDAKWIEVRREWWKNDQVGWSVRSRQQRKFRKREDRTWNFPCSEWKDTASAPAPGAKRMGFFVTQVDNDFGIEHLVEFKVLKREVLR